jgi:cytochrome c551/c552
MNLKRIGVPILALSILSFGVLVHAASAPSENGLSIVFSRPADGSRLPWKSQVPYSVVVTYDGKSTKFGELPAKYVIVRAASAANADAAAARPSGLLNEGLIQIAQSNCTGCHDFAANSAGPSFTAIGKRYAGQKGASETLAAHIRGGSKGSWGPASMPPHPDMSAVQAIAIARWIVTQAADPAVHYSVGTSGSFTMSPPSSRGPRSGMVLSAFYTGPLRAGDMRRPMRGKDRVVLYGSGS